MAYTTVACPECGNRSFILLQSEDSLEIRVHCQDCDAILKVYLEGQEV